MTDAVGGTGAWDVPIDNILSVFLHVILAVFGASVGLSCDGNTVGGGIVLSGKAM